MALERSAAPRVSVVIPNWNGREFLPVILESLRAQTFGDFETIVVDNASTDGSVELLAREYPEVEVRRLPENRGFSAAVNVGIRAGRGEYVALLNNDLELEPAWMAEIVAALDADRGAGSAASRIRQYWARERMDSAGDRIRGVPEGRGYGEPDGPEFDTDTDVASPCAAAALYRRSMLDEIGLFNEELFAYYEDVELGMRAQLAGYRCRYVARAVCYHMGSATSARISRRAAYYRLRNLMQFWWTLLPASYAFRSLPALARPWLHFGVRGGGLRVCMKVALVTLLRAPWLMKRRRELWSQARVSPEEFRRVLEPAPSVLPSLRRRLRSGRGAAAASARGLPFGDPGSRS